MVLERERGRRVIRLAGDLSEVGRIENCKEGGVGRRGRRERVRGV